MVKRPKPIVSPPSPDCEAPRGATLFGKIRTRLRCYRRDVDAVMKNDPAARSRSEVMLTYPGLHAVWMHRMAHGLWNSEQRLGARVLSHTNRFITGVEIHPAATLGQGVFIDHGMGVVIGETTRIGDGCILYKGVVLGGTQRDKTQRHPQIGKNVVIGTNACILGNIHIGDGARIGSGSVVIKPVSENATVVGVPGREMPRSNDPESKFSAALDHADLPDPVTEMLRSLRSDNQQLRDRLARLEAALDLPTDETPDDHLIDGHLATTDLPPQHGG